MFQSPYGPNSNPITAEQREQLIPLIHSHGLESVENQLVNLASNGIFLEPDEEQDITPGCSRMGGLPDVPPGWEWPGKLLFLGQINLAEIAHCDYNGVLPERGLLSFFHDCDYSDDPPFGICHRVYFFGQEPAELQPSPAPPGFLPVSYGHDYVVFRPLKVRPRVAISLPAPSSRVDFELYEADASLPDAYSDLGNDLHPGHGRPHQLLGHHSFIDGDAIEEAWRGSLNLDLQYRDTDISLEQRERTLKNFEDSITRYQTENNAASLKYYQHKRDAFLAYLENKTAADASFQEWMLLFQMDSDDKVGTQFSDAGLAYFMIRRQDLAARRFDRTFAGMWSS